MSQDGRRSKGRPQTDSPVPSDALSTHRSRLEPLAVVALSGRKFYALARTEFD